MRKSVVVTVCVIIAALLGGLGAAGYVFWAKSHPQETYSADSLNILGDEAFLTFCEGIKVDGLDISGMTVREASYALNQLHVSQDEGFKLELVLDNYTNIIGYPDITVRYNTSEILKEALQLGNSGTQAQLDDARAGLAAEGASFTSEKSYSIDNVSDVLASVAQSVYIEPIDATAYFDISLPEKFAYTPGANGRAADIAALEIELTRRMERQDFAKTVQIPVTTLEPLVSSAQLIKKNVMICTYTSEFKAKALGGKDRVFNINKAAELMNGYRVMPGESFDMSAVLGPRTAELGWKRVSGSADGANAAQEGGGVSQSASTLYNAAMMADLEITERTPLLWPVSYVPIGRDAALNAEGANFCFRNNKESPVYVVAYCDMEAKTMTCEIWGEPLQNGMTVQVESKKTGSLKGLGTKTQIDPSLGAGKRRVERQARTGATAETYKRYYDGNGNLLRSELCETTTYSSVEGLVYVSAVPKGSQGSSMQTKTPQPFPVTVQ